MKVMAVRQSLKINDKKDGFLWNVWMRDENNENVHKFFNTKKEARNYAESVEPEWDKLKNLFG